MRRRENLEVWRAALLGNDTARGHRKQQVLPRLAGLFAPLSSTLTTFHTYPIHFHSECAPYVDYEGNEPDIAIMREVSNASDGEVIPGYDMESSRISDADGKLTWSQSMTVQKRTRLPYLDGNGYVFAIRGSDFTLFHLYCKSSSNHHRNKTAEQHVEELM
jgi:hypothetical protein